MEQRRKVTMAERVKMHPVDKPKKKGKATPAAGKQSKQQRLRSKAAPAKKLIRKKPGKAKQAAPIGKRAIRKKKGGR